MRRRVSKSTSCKPVWQYWKGDRRKIATWEGKGENFEATKIHQLLRTLDVRHRSYCCATTLHAYLFQLAIYRK